MAPTFAPENIPAELRDNPQWIVWRWVERKGKRTKPPFSVVTGKPGDATDPSMWMSFDEACSYIGKYDGIGFAVDRTPYTGIDLDHSIDADGTIAPWAEAIIARLGSYAEITPSGSGLRVWVRGKLPEGGRRAGLIELYDAGRYFTVTGAHLDGTPAGIEDGQEALESFHASLFPPKPKGKAKSAAPVPSHTDLTDDDIIRKASSSKTSGAKFAALFSGDASSYIKEDGSPDFSRADLALCSYLAFWFGRDEAAIDRVFRRSGLMREKWDQSSGALTYGARTIAVALESAGASYDPHYRSGAPATNGTAQATGGIAVADGVPVECGAALTNGRPIVTEGDAGRMPGDDQEDREPPRYNRTDLGNARRLVALDGDDIMYCTPWKSWLVWSGRRWERDERGAIGMCPRHVIAQLHREVEDEPDEEMQKGKIKWALACESENRMKAMVSLSREEPGIPVLPESLDVSPYLFNCTNGTIDLRTGRLMPHIRTDRIMKMAGVRYDPDATCPEWLAFVDWVTQGDASLAAFLCRAVGYSLTGDITEHALFFLYGKGRNGKSTFLNTLQYAIGDYSITINADVLTSKNQEDHPTGVADLQGRRFIVTVEVEDGKRLAESLVKSLTGGEKIRARRMRENFFEFNPTHKIWLAANHEPSVRGTDDGIWSRIRKVPFNATIAKCDMDQSLPERLRAEAPGILAWAVRGCLEWQEGGLREPEAVVAATAEYRAGMDVLAEFLTDRCTIAATAEVATSTLYRAYVDWCKSTGTYQASGNRFGRLLNERGFGSRASNSVRMRTGIELREDF